MGWAAVRRPRGFLLPQGLVQRMHPHFLFPLVEKKTGRARSKRKDRLDALRRSSSPPRDGGRRIGASADFGLPSGTLSSSAISGTAVPWRMVRRSSGWLSHCLCFSFRCRWPSRAGTGATGGCGHPPESINPTTTRVARSEAERAERGAGQMRPCTPTQGAPAPRESAFKSIPHPAAPVGGAIADPQAPSHADPVQQLCTRGAKLRPKRLFSYTGRRRSLLGKTKKRMGAHLPSHQHG